MKLLLFLPLLVLASAAETSNGLGNVLSETTKGVEKEIQDIKNPIEQTIITIASSQCSNVKKLLGVSYEQVEGEAEPDLDKLSLEFISKSESEYKRSTAVKKNASESFFDSDDEKERNLNVSYPINEAAKLIPENPQLDLRKPLFIYIHGFTDDPSSVSFSSIRNALFDTGAVNVLALDATSLIRWMYLRSTTYVRFIGAKLGEVLAAMVQGHSLGAHIASFTGKGFTDLTGLQVGRITGLDPAGPCFSHIDDDLRLKATDAYFVDVIHTDAGVYGLNEPCGQVDYYPNDGTQQPNCLLQTCSHNRVWLYFAESVINPQAFPAIMCEDWEHFKKGECTQSVSYMGFASEPGTTGLYFLQTNDESPYGKGMEGIMYQNDESYIKSIFGSLTI